MQPRMLSVWEGKVHWMMPGEGGRVMIRRFEFENCLGKAKCFLGQARVIQSPPRLLKQPAFQWFT